MIELLMLISSLCTHDSIDWSVAARDRCIDYYVTCVEHPGRDSELKKCVKNRPKFTKY